MDEAADADADADDDAAAPLVQLPACFSVFGVFRCLF